MTHHTGLFLYMHHQFSRDISFHLVFFKVFASNRSKIGETICVDVDSLHKWIFCLNRKYGELLLWAMHLKASCLLFTVSRVAFFFYLYVNGKREPRESGHNFISSGFSFFVASYGLSLFIFNSFILLQLEGEMNEWTSEPLNRQTMTDFTWLRTVDCWHLQ